MHYSYRMAIMGKKRSPILLNRTIISADNVNELCRSEAYCHSLYVLCSVHCEIVNKLHVLKFFHFIVFVFAIPSSVCTNAKDRKKGKTVETKNERHNRMGTMIFYCYRIVCWSHARLYIFAHKNERIHPESIRFAQFIHSTSSQTYTQTIFCTIDFQSDIYLWPWKQQ